MAINPYVWGEKPDPEGLAKICNEELPLVLEYLESQLPATGYLFEALSIGDVSIASFFRNAKFARYVLDPTRWPRTAAFVERVLSIPSFQKLMAFEDKLMRTPIPRHREALSGMGAPLMAETYGTLEPRPGVLPT